MNSDHLGFQKPILLLVFNRIETTKKVFEAIRAVKPKYLFVTADGPRMNKEGERKICNTVRAIVTNIDWDCKLVTLFRDENLGCGKAVSEALKWFFNQVEDGIILEDDCLPNQSFFYFCEKMLDLYKTEDQVKIISGTNYLFKNTELLKDDYFFSNYYSIWGWATWKRVVQNINWDTHILSQQFTLKQVEEHFKGNDIIPNWLYTMLKSTFEKKTDTWDSIFVCNLILQNGLSIVPLKNQISNIGIEGTHTSNNVSDNINTKTHAIGIANIKAKKIGITTEFNSVMLENINKYIGIPISKKEKLRAIARKTLRLANPILVMNKLKNIFLRRLGKITFFLGYKLEKKSNTTNSVILTNVYKTNFSKTALLSYVRPVFENIDSKQSKIHTNHHTTFLFGEILNEMGYGVDVINHDCCIQNDFEKYELILGLGKSLDYVLKHRKKTTLPKVIWFGTGCNPFFSNPITMTRLSDFYNKHQVLAFQSSRFIEVDNPLQHELSDYIILHGNSFSKETYRKNHITTVNAPVFINHQSRKTLKDFEKTKRNYLWFGGGGAIHKGLDLVIDAFSKIDHCNLHICGNLENEVDFFNYYKSTFNTSSTIFYHGFIGVETESFKHILESCVFIIYPSASEANCAAVITCMANGGLIPIITKNADVDCDNYGVIINDLTIEEVLLAVKKSQEFSVEELYIQSERIITRTHTVNTFDYFKKDFKQKLSNAIQIIK